MAKQINVSLIGNPNTGKTSVFNLLTGLKQQVGNYPGITVERKAGVCKLSRGVKAHIIDLPGTYSLNASSLDENVVIEVLLNKKDKDYPDVAVVISDVENIKRNLLLFTQIKDLDIPTILVINMADQMERKGITIDIPELEKRLNTKIVLMSARKKIGVEELKKYIEEYKKLSIAPCLNAFEIDPKYFGGLQKAFPKQSLYKLWLVITQDVNFANIDRNTIADASAFHTKKESELKRLQQKETIKRYQFINQTLKATQEINLENAKGVRAALDHILIHKVWGFAIFFLILLFIFQAIYDWSSYPMDLIDNAFAWMSDFFRETLPSGALTNLLVEGIVPGIGGIVIFIPQIAFLFLFISILEESGYMSRVVFIMDRLMRRFGLSGKSIVPLISGTACAIPAVMATRNIENWKQRLITILVVPFTTCSARLPVYLITISLVIPEHRIAWVFGYQSLTLMLLYFIGFGAALISASLLNKFMKIETKSFFVVEMPNYKIPLFKNVAINIYEKTKAFIAGAGKIILAISIILWFLGSNGFSDNFNNAEGIVSNRIQTEGFSDFNKKSIETELVNYKRALQDSVFKKVYQISPIAINDSIKIKKTILYNLAKSQEISSYKLENSYMGYMGKAITPIVEPLGYDWKIGIAVLTSFAAREVFVSTLATIYSVGSEEEETIKNRMASEINPANGKPLFDFATGISLLLFYAFAMQCASTIAIVKKETNGWMWPSIQFIFMSGLAYVAALIAYQFLK